MWMDTLMSAVWTGSCQRLGVGRRLSGSGGVDAVAVSAGRVELAVRSRVMSIAAPKSLHVALFHFPS
jgi:hypothetical protein